jgi:CARDB
MPVSIPTRTPPTAQGTPTRRRQSRPRSGILVAASVGALLCAAAAVNPASAASGAPDLVITALTTSAHQVAAGNQVTVSDTTKNRGAAKAGASTTGYYLSKDKTRSSSDKTLGSRSIAQLAPGKLSSGKKTVTVPAATTTGTYYVLACADSKKAVRESSETNNCKTVQVAVTHAASGPFPQTPNPITTFAPTLTHPSFVSGSGAVTPTTSTTLTETMPDGTIYSLSIPANAVSQPVTVTMTPLSALTGAPTTWVAGVRLQPTGVELYQDATLTITPAVALGTPTASFRFFDGGADPSMYPISGSAAGAYTLPITSLATYGLGSSTAAQVATMLAHPPVHVDGQLANQAGPLTWPAPPAKRALTAPHAAGTGPAGDFFTNLAQAYSAYYTDVVKPGLTQAETDDTVAPDAIAKALGWASDLSKLGGGDTQEVTDATTQAVTVLKAAVTQENLRCHNNHSLHDLGFLLGNARAFAVLGDQTDENTAFNDALACGHFTATWHSATTLTKDFSGGTDVATYTLSAAFDVTTGPVDLTWNATAGFTGQGTLHYNTGTYSAHWLYAGCPTTEDLNLTATHDGPVTLTLDVPFLVLTGPGVPQNTAYLTMGALSMGSAPNETYHEVTVTPPCPDGGSTTTADEALPEWQLALKAAGLANPLPLTPLADAQTVFDQTFTWDGVEPTSGGMITEVSPNEHSEITVSVDHTPQ